MKRWIGPLVVMALTAVFAHWLALGLAPGFIMDRAMAALEARGVALHRFTVPHRVTPQTQQIVRSSPDLYYALCRYDLRQPAGIKQAVPRLAVTMAAWDDYQSLSFFDARTNNFATIRGTGKAVKVQLQTGLGENGFVDPYLGHDPEKGGPEFIVYTPTETGVILIRRLAPSGAAFAKAAAAGKGDRCSHWMQQTTEY
jgi:uncharacterized membrane protein